MSDLADGTQIGPYRIVRVAGRGAVGVVYLAEHVVLGRRVAVKTLNRHYAGESIFRERFSREAQGAASVTHPNIISVFDAGEHDGLPYLVMAYVDGPDLERVLADRGGSLAPAEAVLVCAAVADALDAAGRQGLAHRDVKPANILLEGWDPDRYGGTRRRPHAYLTDFGLIKSSAQATVTRTGQFVGTLLYMSPEQIQSRALPASDQYSLACVLWECLTGTLPFQPQGTSTLSVISAHLTEPVPDLSSRPGGPWPPELDEVFRRALAKSPDDRHPSCVAFVDAVTRALGLGAAAPRLEPVPPASTTTIPQALLGVPDDPQAAPPAAPPPHTEPTPAPPTPGRPTPHGPGGRGAGPPPPLAGASPVVQTPNPDGGSPPPYVPAGLPPELTPTNRDGGSGSRTWIAVLVVVVLIAAAVTAILLTRSHG